MAAEGEQGGSKKKNDETAITQSGESHDTPTQGQPKTNPKKSGMLNWAHSVVCWPLRAFFWILRGLKSFDGLITAIATIAIGIVAWLQWETFEKTDSTLRAGQRAFVAGALNLTPVRDPATNKVEMWRVLLFLENSGSTAATSVEWRFDFGLNSAADPDISDLTIPTTPLNYGSGVLLPKQRNLITEGIFTRSKIEELTKGQGAHFMGEVTYKDAFDERHRTKFCFRIYGGPWNASMPPQVMDWMIDRLDLSYSMCRRNNCADDDCKTKKQQGAGPPQT